MSDADIHELKKALAPIVNRKLSPKHVDEYILSDLCLESSLPFTHIRFFSLC